MTHVPLSPFVGWLFKLEVENPGETNNLMTEEKYNEFLKSHEQH